MKAPTVKQRLLAERYVRSAERYRRAEDRRQKAWRDLRNAGVYQDTHDPSGLRFLIQDGGGFYVKDWGA